MDDVQEKNDVSESAKKVSTKKRSRRKTKTVTITGPSVMVDGKAYGEREMNTVYETDMELPDRKEIHKICATAYIDLLCHMVEHNLPKKVGD